jgi:pSer/pThr/pTyr-binding forkhead associated (FHA) protein
VHLVVPPGGSFREPRRIELGQGVLTIGRSEACDVRIDVPGVDDEHAKISEVALIAVGADCAVGDVPLDAGQRRLVMPGDEIQIGSVVIALDGHDPALLPGHGRAVPRIRVVEGQNFGDELVLAMENQEYVIGRSPKADLVLEDREVSREHIKVVRRAYSVFIYDQASTRGSWLGRAAVYQGSRLEWDRPRMLKVGATVLSLDLPDDGRRARPMAMPSAPMTPPPRRHSKSNRPPPPMDTGPPPANIVAYHYEAKPPPETPILPSPPPMGLLPEAHVPAPYASQHPAPAPGSMGVGAYPSHPPLQSSQPPPGFNARPSAGPRTAWKKTGPTIGRTSGILLLALAGLAILGALFVVFSLME